MRQIILISWLVLALAALAVADDGQPAGPSLAPRLDQVMRQVPADTHLVLVVPSVEELTTGMAAFGKRIGSSDVANITAGQLLTGPLGEALAALDVHGPFVLAASAQRDEPLLLMTVTDISVWEESAKFTRTSTGRVFEFEAERYAGVTADGVAVVAREKADVERGLQAAGEFARAKGPQIARLVSGRDAALWVEVKPWVPLVEQGLAFFEHNLCCGIAAAGPEGEAAIQFWRMALDKLRELIGQARTYAAGVTINADGVRVSDETTFAEGGSVVGYLQKVGRSQRDILRGLPDGDAVVVFGSEWTTPPGTPSLNEIFSKALLKVDSLKQKIGGEKLEAAMRLNIETYRLLTGLNGVVVTGEDGCSIRSYGLYLTDQQEAVRGNLRQVFTSCPELIDAWGTFPATNLKHQRVTLDSREADVYSFNFDTAATATQPMIGALYGPEPQLWVAPHPEGVAYSLGSEQTARQFFDNPDHQMVDNPRLIALRQRLSPAPQFCIVVDVAQFFSFISGLMGQMGIPAPPLEPEHGEYPLAGAAVYLDESAVRLEAFVPAETIGAIIQRFNQPQRVGFRE